MRSILAGATALLLSGSAEAVKLVAGLLLVSLESFESRDHNFT